MVFSSLFCVRYYIAWLYFYHYAADNPKLRPCFSLHVSITKVVLILLHSLISPSSLKWNWVFLLIFLQDFEKKRNSFFSFLNLGYWRKNCCFSSILKFTCRSLYTYTNRKTPFYLYFISTIQYQCCIFKAAWQIPY